MADIRNEDIITYFENRNNRFRNSAGMEFGKADGNVLWTFFSLSNHDYGPNAFDISTEADTVDEFIAGFKLNKTEDVDHLGYTQSWMRYLNGEAEISVTPFQLEATLKFKINKYKTIIFSLELYFYDEVYEHLTIPEDFERYISSHENRLALAGENRYKMNRN
jgi:hypothetical protein